MSGRRRRRESARPAEPRRAEPGGGQTDRNAGAGGNGLAGRPGSPRQGWLLRILLALLVLAAFANSFPGAYLSDDYPIVLNNPLVIQPRLSAILTADYWGEGVNMNHHRPLTILSYVVNRALFGPGPFSFHLVNVLQHGGVTLMLYETFLALGVGSAVGWAAAALFAVHPIHTETVNIITGRSELLPALFMLLGLLLARRAGRLLLPAVGACHAAALLSKESAVIFPLLLLVTDAFGERDLGALLRRRWRLYAQSAALTTAWLAMRWALPAAALPSHLSVRPLDNPLLDLSLPWRLATALKVQLLYLGKLVFPLRLHAVYVDRMLGPVTGAGDLSWMPVLLGATALLGLAVFGWRRREAYSLGLAWYGAAFLLTGNFFVTLPYLMAERFAYTPSAGFCLAVAALAAATLRNLDARTQRRAAGVVLGLALALLAGRTLVRNGDFREHIAFWEAETRSEPANARAWLFLADAYRLKARWDDAERALLAVTRLDPALPEPWVALGELWRSLGRIPEARSAFQRALDADFISQDAVSGFVDTSLRLGLPLDALALLTWAEPLFSDRGWYWHLTGRSRDAAGDRDGAVAAFRTALTRADCPAETPGAIRDLLDRMGGGRAAPARP